MDFVNRFVHKTFVLIFAIILVIGCFFGCIIVSGWIENYRFGEDAVWGCINNLVLVAIIVTSFGILWCLQIWFPRIFFNPMAKLDIPIIGKSIHRWMKRRVLFTVSMIGIIIATNLICINWFTLLTEDGISTYHLLQVKRYKWEDVSSYKIGTKDDSLSMKLVMEDGSSHEILANGSYSNSDSFGVKFEDDFYNYAVYIDVILEELGKEQVIEDKDTILSKLKENEPNAVEAAEKLIE